MGREIVALQGVIVGYRRGKAVQYNNQVLVKIFADPSVINTLIGSEIRAEDLYGNIYRGKVIKVHSRRNSVVIARFKPNIPGQLIGQRVEIIKR